MAYASSLLGITISYAQNAVGDIAIASKSMNALTLGYSYMPGSSVKNSTGDIFVNAAFTDTDYKKGGMAYSTILHELGHALGLDHPFGAGDYAGIDVNDTIMSYNKYNGHDAITNNDYSIYSFTSFEEADITALRSLYGASAATQTDDTYTLADMLFSETISGYTIPIKNNLFTILDDGGKDTISLAGIDHGAYLDLSGNTQSVIMYGTMHHYLNIASGTIIENAIGSNYNDTFVLNSANNTIDGKMGIDTVYVTTNDTMRIDTLNGKVLLSSKESGLDTLASIEQLYINDLLINTSLYQRTQKHYALEQAPEIAKLYLSVFDRLSDESGLNYWINDYTSGTTLKNIAESFVLSHEFISLYGTSQTNTDYINMLYQNVLYRDADQAGLVYWQDEMQHGSSKADVLLSFSNSTEFSVLTQPYFQDNNIFLL
ncbi:MAG: DUF4214 domain-containing protein [Campylobacterales bacterium]|nr:DUF4214 domain-containing protein [Campylobacterales bacterium]